MIGFYAAGAMGQGGAPAPPTDPYWANVISLLHLDGTDGSTTITDQKGKIWTNSGSSALDTDQARFGPSSVYFPNGGRITSVTDTNDAFGTGDFTIEFWIWLNGTPATDIAFDTRDTSASSQPRPTIYFAGTAAPIYYVSNANRITGSAMTTGVWHHLAICRSGTSTRMFVDGVQSGSTWTDSTNYTNDRLRYGDSSYSAGTPMNGWIDEARITKGVARYTSNFTPPSAAFPDS